MSFYKDYAYHSFPPLIDPYITPAESLVVQEASSLNKYFLAKSTGGLSVIPTFYRLFDYANFDTVEEAAQFYYEKSYLKNIAILKLTLESLNLLLSLEPVSDIHRLKKGNTIRFIKLHYDFGAKFDRESKEDIYNPENFNNWKLSNGEVGGLLTGIGKETLSYKIDNSSYTFKVEISKLSFIDYVKKVEYLDNCYYKGREARGQAVMSPRDNVFYLSSNAEKVYAAFKFQLLKKKEAFLKTLNSFQREFPKADADSNHIQSIEEFNKILLVGSYNMKDVAIGTPVFKIFSLDS